MSVLVLDNSVVMRWCFEEAAPYADKILEQLHAGDEAHVPFVWLSEVVSVLAKSQSKGSLTMEKAHDFMEDLRSLEIAVDTESMERIFTDVHRLAVEYNLSGYDAAYLELALRKKIPLASLDEALNKAARIAGVELVKG